MAAFIDVELNLSRGYRGAIAETHSELRSGLMSENAPSGVFLAYESALDRTLSLKVVDTNTDKIVGVGVYQPFRSTATDGSELVEDRMENYLDRGVIWVICEEAINPEDPVYVRHTANGAGKLQLGAVRNDADTANCVLLEGAKFAEKTTGAGLAKVKLNLPA